MHCVDYNKHGLLVCVDNISCYINLVIKKLINGYIFVEFMYPKVKINNAIKKVISLKNKDSALHDTIAPIIDKLLNAPFLKDKFAYFMLSDESHEKIMGDEDYPGIYVCISDSYGDTFTHTIFNDKLRMTYT